MSATAASPPPAAGEAQTSALAAAVFWLVPPLLCLAVYWRGLGAWFQADDFAWLTLRLQVHDWGSLLQAMFAPMAQGTIRPWSERAFFMGLESLFGINAVPFRVCVFLTQCANLALLAAVTRRITGSRTAGFWAAIFWLVNYGLALTMVWSSVYNQILCGFFLLGAFWFLLRYIETGRRGYCWWQWLLFLLGFGALEINVVYPALAALYTFLCARAYFKTTLPLFIPSALFTVIHTMAAPSQNGGVYALHVDAALPRTLLNYGFRALLPDNLYELYGGPDVLLACLFAAAVITFTVVRARQKDWLPLFCLGWFGIVIAPVLPLRDHVSPYYLALPTLGLAMLCGYALVFAWRRRQVLKITASILTAAYLFVMIAADWRATSWWYGRSLAIKRMVLGVARAHQLHPTQAILLDGVDSNLFWAGMFHHPLDVFGVSQVYLTPGSADRIDSHPQLGLVADYELPSGPTIHGLDNNQIVVYGIGPVRLKAITSVYEDTVAPQLSPDPPRRVDVGSPLMAYLLGPEWYSPDGSSRWMPQRATLRIGGPRLSSERLRLHGFCPDAMLRAGPVDVRVTIDGNALPEVRLQNGASLFDVSFPLPNEALGKSSLDVSVNASRSFRASGDSREVSLMFGLFEIR
jgi:hypothetical protein